MNIIRKHLGIIGIFFGVLILTFFIYKLVISVKEENKQIDLYKASTINLCNKKGLGNFQDRGSIIKCYDLKTGVITVPVE